MPVLLWAILALVAGLLVLAIAARAGAPSATSLPADVELPATHLQRLARRGLAAGLVLALAAGGLLVAYGPARLYESDRLRLGFTALLLGIAAVFLIAKARLRVWTRRGDGTLDERDRAILERAPAFQSGAMLVTLAVWIVGLVERFHGAGAVPHYYLYLVFWSCWVVDLLALPVGVLVGYRRR